MKQQVALRAGVYDRNSKADEKSIDDQGAANRAAVQENGWTLVGEYSDGVSASRFGTRTRRGWKRLLQDLDTGELDVIATWEPSRADRDLETWVQFVAKCRTRGVLVHLTGDDSTRDPRKHSDWKTLIDGGVDAAFESEKTSNRVLRGVASAAVDGGFHGDVPYGYERVIVGEKRTQRGTMKVVREQRPHPVHGPIVAEILERLSRNDAITAIVRDLDARQVPSPGDGKSWERNTVRKMAFNVAYIGKRRHKTEVYDGTWPALVSETTFYAAQRVVADPRRKTSQPGRLKWLLSYLAVAPCGSGMSYAAPRQGRTARYHCILDGCTTIPVEETDEFVTIAVVERLCLPYARDLFTSDDSAAQQAEQDAARLREKLAEARAQFLLPDGMSAASFTAFERALLPQIEAADARARKLSGAPIALQELLDAAKFGAEVVRPLWDSYPVPARREVLSLVLGTVRIGAMTHRLNRFTSGKDRYDAAAARITIEK